MSDSVYVIVQMTVTDPAFGSDYAAPLLGQLTALGVEVLAADPDPRVVEGRYDRNNTVILRFPSAAVFDGWYRSDAYAPLMKIRERMSDPARTRMLLLEAFGAPKGAEAGG